jgi:hypothetical protein
LANAGMMRHVQKLDFFFIGRSSRVARQIFLFRFVELDGSTTSECQDAIFTVLGELISRNI